VNPGNPQCLLPPHRIVRDLSIHPYEEDLPSGRGARAL
jgi:hypothetical protein